MAVLDIISADHFADEQILVKRSTLILNTTVFSILKARFAVLFTDQYNRPILTAFCFGGAIVQFLQRTRQIRPVSGSRQARTVVISVAGSFL
jgi:hypothetical protein